MRTRLAAAARPCTIIPFPPHRARRVVPCLAEFDPFDHGIALAERDLRDVLLCDGWATCQIDALVDGLFARCNLITTETQGGAL